MSLRRLVQQFVDSRLQLELLAAMAADPARSWSAREVIDAFGVPAGQAHRHLEALCARNVLDVRVGNTVRYRFAPGAPDVSAAMKALISAYRQRPTEVAALVPPAPCLPSGTRKGRSRRGGAADH